VGLSACQPGLASAGARPAIVPAGHDRYPIGADGQEAAEVVIKLWPRLDPLARALTLTFEGPSEQVTLDVAW